jgi:hypothetical protein
MCTLARARTQAHILGQLDLDANHMRTKTTPRTIAYAGKSPRSRKRSFTSGLLFGVSAASLFLAGDLPRPKAPTEGFESDWNAVGRDLRGAMTRHDA